MSESAVPGAAPVQRLLTRTFALACAMQLSGSLACAMYLLFPLYVRSLGGGEATIGLLAGIGAAAAVLVRLPLSVLLDRSGRKPIMLLAAGLHAFTSLGFPIMHELDVWFVSLVAVNAMCAGAMFTSFVTYAADIVPITRRAQGLAWFGVWGMTANGLGPLLGEWLQREGGFPPYFAAAALLAGISALVAWSLPEPHERGGRRPAGDANNSPRDRRFLLVLVLTFLFGLSEASVFTFLAPFLQSVAGGGAGKVFFAYAMAAVTVRVVSSSLPDRVGRAPVLGASFFLYGAALLAMPRAGSELRWIAGILAGVGHGYAFPVLAALAVDLAGGRRGRAVSWFTAMFDVGHSLGNPALGLVAEYWGYHTMYTVVGSLALGSAVLVCGNSSRLAASSPPRSSNFPTGPTGHGPRAAGQSS